MHLLKRNNGEIWSSTFTFYFQVIQNNIVFALIAQLPCTFISLSQLLKRKLNNLWSIRLVYRTSFLTMSVAIFTVSPCSRFNAISAHVNCQAHYLHIKVHFRRIKDFSAPPFLAFLSLTDYCHRNIFPAPASQGALSQRSLWAGTKDNTTISGLILNINSMKCNCSSFNHCSLLIVYPAGIL